MTGVSFLVNLAWVDHPSSGGLRNEFNKACPTKKTAGAGESLSFYILQYLMLVGADSILPSHYTPKNT